MAANKKLMFLPGDGIGQEVMGQVRRVIDWMGANRALTFDVEEGLVGGAAFDVHGDSITDETMADCVAADAVLLGAVGGPKWDHVAYEKRPEAALLRLRGDMDLFANLRPAVVFDALIDASTLKPEIVRGLDIMILRELTSGVYFGKPKEIVDLPNGSQRGVDTQVYTTEQIERIVRVACELAKKRNNKVTVAQKANVMMTGVLWRDVSQALHDREFPEVEFNQMYADNAAMQLIRDPQQFDVLVTDNLFGDVLSDEAAMMTGSLGMLPSASLGAVDPDTGKQHALYEPVHGTAPDIAGQDKANPLATMLSFAMMLRYSFDLGEEADLIEQAAKNVLGQGKRTGDIMTPGGELVSTTQMGEALLGELTKLTS
jgi:3-isopropylmalate dehydrogenase